MPKRIIFKTVMLKGDAGGMSEREVAEAISAAVAEESAERKTADSVLAQQIDQIVSNNTTNASGWAVASQTDLVDPSSSQTGAFYGIDAYFTVPSGSVLLEVSYSAGAGSGGESSYNWKTDGLNVYRLSDTEINVRIPDMMYSRYIRIAYAYSGELDLSELTDIRIGADSTVYTSAGAAVRTQIADLQDQFDSIKGSGQPIPVTLAEQMTDTEAIYLYLGEETGYEYGYNYVYLDDVWTETTLYGVGQIGEDGYSPSASVVQTLTGASINITDKNGTTTAEISNGSATDEQVAEWLDNHPEATTTVQDGSITEAKLSDDLKAKISDSGSDKSDEIEKEYAYPTYTQNALDNSGNATTGNSYLTNYLPVIGGEKLTLANSVTSKVAFYTENKIFISLISTSSGINDYTVPANAKFARYQNALSGGDPKPFGVRRKNQPENKNFFDLVTSPLNCNPSICITGDSNTYGYGLSNTTQAWSYLFLNTLANMTKFRYGTQSRWCEAIGPFSYSSGYNYKSGTELSIYTDATSITLGIKSNYSSAWSWYIDGVVQSSYASTATLPLDGNMHKVTARFTGGQAVDPYFEITKNITFVNKAVSGVGINNLPLESGHDWLIVMIGTNNRNIDISSDIANTLYEYYGKGTFIVPFPNHKTDASYTHSEMETYSHLEEAFINAHFDIINASDIAGNLFYDDTFYQADKIHFNAEGHRKIANLISGRIGFPLHLKSES